MTFDGSVSNVLVLELRMRNCGWARYGVFDGLNFLGIVFQFRPDSDGAAVRWLAQESRSGVIHGWTVPIRTRKAAGEILAAKAGAK